MGSQTSGLIAGILCEPEDGNKASISRDTLAAVMSAELLLRDMSEEKSWG